MQQTFKVEFVENKSNDWKVAQLRDEHDKEYKDVSINRVGKKGDTFPNFDAIMPGASIEGVYWQSDAGKNYLFPPRPEGAQPPRRSPSAINTAMKKKEESIEKFQDAKETSIKISSTLRDAVTLAQVEIEKGLFAPNTLEDRIRYWREWLWVQWDKVDFKPF